MSVDADALTLDAADWGRGGAVRLGTVTDFDAQRCRARVRIAGDGETSAGDGETSAGDGETSAGDGETSAGDGETSVGDGETSVGDGETSVRTGWLPWATWAAGHLRVWSPPAIGEQCLVLAPSGDMAQAVALPAVFQQQRPGFAAPSDKPEHTLLAWDDGGYIRYERDTHSMFMHAPQRLTVTAGAEIVIQAPMVRVN